MNIELFNKDYWLRHFGEQEEVRGYLTSGYTDRKVKIHVHPLGTDKIAALPEGERLTKRLEGHGTVPICVSNMSENRKGDLLYYDGNWYECIDSQLWDHTVLCHYNYQFVAVPKDASGIHDLHPPEGGNSSL